MESFATSLAAEAGVALVGRVKAVLMVPRAKRLLLSNLSREQRAKSVRKLRRPTFIFARYKSTPNLVL